MNVPPPPPPSYGYENRGYAPQKPKKNPLVIIFAILGVLMLCCGLPIGAVVFYGSKAIKGAMSVGGCVANTAMLNDALERYVKEKKTYPKAETWQTDLKGYLKSSEMQGADKKAPFKIWSPEGEWSCEEGGQTTGFAFNDEFSGKKPEDIKTPEETVIVFETKTVGYNQHSKYQALPYSESPKVFSEFTDERRGWLVLTAAHKLAGVDKNGKVDPNSSFGSSFSTGYKAGSKAGKKIEVNFGDESETGSGK